MRDEKLLRLRKIIGDTGGLAIAFSGGLDSTLLAAVAVEVLGGRALAVTALSPTYPDREQKDAVDIAREIGISHELVDSNELEIDGFAQNPVDRCYYCKRELFKVVRDVARRHGIDAIADGTNADDENDYRPGRKAAVESDVLSPLLMAGLGKEDIREISRKMGLSTAEKPAFACLASRFPYGDEITDDKLKAVDVIEQGMRDMGFKQVRVRHHGEIARIEVDPADVSRVTSDDVRLRIIGLVKDTGFHYVALDLEGYRTGSMNEPIL